jgi:hypothetical protein
MGLFALLFVGDMIFSAVGGIHRMPKQIQDAYGWIKENKIQFGFMVFFMGSMVSANLL